MSDRFDPSDLGSLLSLRDLLLGASSWCPDVASKNFGGGTCLVSRGRRFRIFASRCLDATLLFRFVILNCEQGFGRVRMLP